MDINGDPFKKGEIAFDLIKRRYDSEVARINDLDGKAGTQIGFISVVLSIVIGAGTFQLLDKLAAPQLFFPYFIGIGLLITSFLYSLKAFKVREWVWAPKTDITFQEGFNPPYSAFSIMRKSSEAMHIAIVDMEEKNNQKAKKIGKSWYYLLGGLAFIIIYVMIVVLSGLEADTIIDVKNMTVGNMTVL
jgi:hypothetical protein